MPIKDELELAAKIVAVAVPSFSALKASVTYARDRSLLRRQSEALNKVDSCVERMSKLRENSDLFAIRCSVGCIRAASQARSGD